jgi:hypothetical protein
LALQVLLSLREKWLLLPLLLLQTPQSIFILSGIQGRRTRILATRHV